MKKLLILFFVFSLVSFTTPSYAEHSIGFAAGATRGAGATYRYLPDPGSEDSWGWQVVGLPHITPDEGTVSLGGAALYLLHRGKVGMAYASLGAGYLSRWENCTEEDDIHCEDESHWGMGIGPGVGFELRMVENFGFSVDVPVAILFADGEFHGVYPLPNTALVFYW